VNEQVQPTIGYIAAASSIMIGNQSVPNIEENPFEEEKFRSYNT